MPSKGVKCFAYIGVPGVEIEFTTPGQAITKSGQNEFTMDQLEVESSRLPRFKFTGQFKFTVRRGGRELNNQWVDVNSMTGSLENGTMKDMEQTPSTFAEDVIICYGFYDAGPGVAGLPSQHQCYVTVTRNLENWMRDVIPQDQDMSSRGFNRMVLPSSHDIGMNSMQTAYAMLQHAGTGIIKDVLGLSLPHIFDVFNKFSDSAINGIAPNIIRGLAVTQKDNLEAILKIGARYFEFRPAKCLRQMQAVSPLADDWYFMHGGIPGMPYKQFLTDIVEFLASHNDEIVVVHNRWDGVPGDCPRPSEDDLRAVADEVLQGKDLQIGNEDDMNNTSIRDLRSARKRLLILQNASQTSNYDDAANATLTGDPIIDRLNDMADNNPPSGHSVTLLQCQATATNIRDVVIASVVDADVSTSPILATKPVCDGKVLALLRGDQGKKLTANDGLVVVLNDFFEGATADVAVQMCRERLG